MSAAPAATKNAAAKANESPIVLIALIVIFFSSFS
jgi:hypothetical protein